MAEQEYSLSRRSAEVLRLISQGHTYEQILSIHPEMTYLDIFRAAGEALEALETPARESSAYEERLSRVRESHARAYDKWTPSEDAELSRLAAMGESAEEIAKRLQRQPSAVRSRMTRLNLSENDISG